MKVLHVATSFVRGGAANMVRLLHEALLAAGHTSHVLVGRPPAPRSDVAVLPRIPWWGRASYHGLNLMGLNYAGIPHTWRMAEHPLFKAAEVVHYHNLHGGYFNYLALPYLTRRKPSVWTLHDMWGLTGHCAHSFECERWRTGCGRCPYPKIDPPIRRDATRWEWRLKRRVYRRSPVLVTAPSAWLVDLTRASVLGVRPVRQVANAVDTDLYRPQDKRALRQRLGWPLEATVLLFAAESLNNPFKDFRILPAALGGLPADVRAQLVLAVLGTAAPDSAGFGGLRTLSLGYHDDEAALADFYAAADLFLYPTRADNQPRVLLEALACGCPAVATRVGGVPELIRHGETGYLARPGDADDMRDRVQMLLNDPAARARMGSAGRQLVVDRYSVARHVAEMVGAYQEAIALWPAGGKAGCDAG